MTVCILTFNNQQADIWTLYNFIYLIFNVLLQTKNVRCGFAFVSLRLLSSRGRHPPIDPNGRSEQTLCPPTL